MPSRDRAKCTTDLAEIGSPIGNLNIPRARRARKLRRLTGPLPQVPATALQQACREVMAPTAARRGGFLRRFYFEARVPSRIAEVDMRASMSKIWAATARRLSASLFAQELSIRNLLNR